jgi:hypothetical protein
MPRIRLILLTLFAVLAVSSVAASGAFADDGDEYAWHTGAGGVHLKKTESKKIVGKLMAGTALVLEGTVGATAVEIECKKITTSAANIKGNEGAKTAGTDEATIAFEECKLVGSPLCTITVANAEVNSEIVEIKSRAKEDEVPPGTETGLDLVGILFTPKGTNFTTITSQGAECAIKFTERPVTGNTVAEVSPEEVLSKVVKLIWKDSNNVTCIHKVGHAEANGTCGTAGAVGLKFAGNAAELIGTVEVELQSGEVFNAFGPKE